MATAASRVPRKTSVNSRCFHSTIAVQVSAVLSASEDKASFSVSAVLSASENKASFSGDFSPMSHAQTRGHVTHVTLKSVTASLARSFSLNKPPWLGILTRSCHRGSVTTPSAPERSDRSDSSPDFTRYLYTLKCFRVSLGL